MNQATPRQTMFYSDKAFILLDKYSPSAVLYEQQNLYFQFLPDEFSESRSAEYSNQTVIGRSENYLGYSHSQNRKVSISLSFFAVNSLLSDVVIPVKWLQSLILPNQLKGITLPPPTLLVRLGEALSGPNANGMFRCVLSSYSVSWGHPFDLHSMTPYSAKIDLTFEGVNVLPDEGAKFAKAYSHVGSDIAAQEALNTLALRASNVPKGTTESVSLLGKRFGG